MTWLRNEDKAVKAKFAGLAVTDANAPTGRPVSVKFATPEMELSQLSIPCILISAQSMSRAPEREHRGYAAVTYWPEGTGVGDSARLDPKLAPKVEAPVPMDIPYQITVLCRRQEHRTQITAVLAQTDYLPARFGYVSVVEDGTTRSLFLDGGPEYSSILDQDQKRLLLSHYSIRIPTEIPPVIAPDTPVSTVVVTTGEM